MRIFRNVFSLPDQKQWLLDHKPVQCALCKSWQFKKDIFYEITTTGQRAALCETCYQELYSPFTKELK